MDAISLGQLLTFLGLEAAMLYVYARFGLEVLRRFNSLHLLLIPIYMPKLFDVLGFPAHVNSVFLATIIAAYLAEGLACGPRSIWTTLRNGMFTVTAFSALTLLMGSLIPVPGNETQSYMAAFFATRTVDINVVLLTAFPLEIACLVGLLHLTRGMNTVARVLGISTLLHVLETLVLTVLLPNHLYDPWPLMFTGMALKSVATPLLCWAALAGLQSYGNSGEPKSRLFASYFRH